MLLIIAGNGKGKTTSALGTAIRSAGWGYKTAIVFFDKGGDHYGERGTLDQLKDKIDVFRFGLPRFEEKSKTFRFRNVPGDLKQNEAGITQILKLYDQDYFLIVADELLNAMRLKLVAEKRVRELIKKCPKETHLLLTGRNAPPWLIEKADLVSDIQEVKHYFKQGQDAIKGIDY